ncbi:MAG: phosphomannomutase/phosphoglucomutase [Patescibacteria group bacterium]|nr:phosphomannomutase/phosphoglucomutase [Patescibacteria group bacterium]
MPTKAESFKAYDIRGIYPEEIDRETAYNLGRALITFTGAKTVIVGKDVRISSDTMEEELIRGINDQGANVIKLGLATSPLIYYASGKLDVELGVMITASHNPAEYNGFKLCRKNAIPIGESSGMEEIKALVLNANFNNPEQKGGVTTSESIKEELHKYIAGFFKKAGKCKIVVDFANAMGILDRKVFTLLGEYIETVYMYDEYDGNFPNHEANPLKTSTLKELQRKVIKEKADLGVSYDGDADRVGFVDEIGEVVPMDFITGLIAKEVLKDHPGGLILMDLRSSNAVQEFIEASDGRVDKCRVGHSLIKKQMCEEGAIFAGELSGHYFFEENFKAELSTLAIIMIINLLNESGKTMSELAHELKKYHHSGEINSTVKSKEKVFLKLKEKYSGGELNELDGVRIDFSDWWFNVRASNTEPKIRLNLEAKTKKMMEEKRDEILKIIRV